MRYLVGLMRAGGSAVAAVRPLIFAAFLLLPVQCGDDDQSSRALRRGEGKLHGDSAGDDHATRSALHSTRSRRRHHSRAPRAGTSGGGAQATAAAQTTPETPSGCCWSFDDKSKRYQYYPRPANQACVAPYKPAACPGAGSPPSAAPPAAAAQAATAAVASSPPPPELAATLPKVEASAATSLRNHEKPHESAKAQAKAAANAKAAADTAAAAAAAAAVASGPVASTTAVPSISAGASPPAAAPLTAKPSSSGGGSGESMFGMLLLVVSGGAAFYFRSQLKEALVRSVDLVLSATHRSSPAAPQHAPFCPPSTFRPIPQHAPFRSPAPCGPSLTPFSTRSAVGLLPDGRLWGQHSDPCKGRVEELQEGAPEGRRRALPGEQHMHHMHTCTTCTHAPRAHVHTCTHDDELSQASNTCGTLSPPHIDAHVDLHSRIDW